MLWGRWDAPSPTPNVIPQLTADSLSAECLKMFSGAMEPYREDTCSYVIHFRTHWL